MGPFQWASLFPFMLCPLKLPKQQKCNLNFIYFDFVINLIHVGLKGGGGHPVDYKEFFMVPKVI